MSSTLEHTAPELHGFGEAVLKMFMHSAPIGFAFLDRNLRFVAVNDKLAEINGLPAEAHIGRHVLEILPTLAATVEEVADRIVQTGKPVPNHEFTGETRATIGEQRWWSESWYPIHDPQGTLIGFGAMVEDITERKRAEAAVEAARERRRKALSIETVGRLIFNLEGRILESNAAVEHMSGYSIDELRSMNHWDVLTPPEYAGVTARAIEELATLGKTAPYEMELVRKDGTRWWGLFASTRVAGQGRQSECVEFIIDITKEQTDRARAKGGGSSQERVSGDTRARTSKSDGSAEEWTAYRQTIQRTGLAGAPSRGRHGPPAQPPRTAG
jgi:PAS domain S-box-containing protein